MDSQSADDIKVEAIPLPIQEIPEDRAITQTILPYTTNPPLKLSKAEIRTSLKALTIESVFAGVFYSIIGGALLSNFLLELGAGPVEIGLLGSIPQLVNLLQPLGAYLLARSASFHWYSMCIFFPSRLLWVILVPVIGLVSSSHLTGYQVVQLTLAILLVSNIIEALGRAPWLGWSAVLVPQRLRGRYFGFRNSLLGLTNFIAVPLLGLAVSKWPGGTLQGYGAILISAIVLGLVSLVSQFWMTDVNPQLIKAAGSDDTSQSQPRGIDFSFLKDANFVKFVLYIAIWCFAVNLSAPFFNLYLLDNLDIDISVVTIYNGLGTGANMLLLLLWGRLADRIGNRPLLLLVGVLVAVTPLLWLVGGTNPISLWVWLPLLHILTGGTWAAIDLCTNNLMMGVAPLNNQSTYFGITGAVAGVSGAIGITVGSFLATLPGVGGLLGLFALSGVLRLLALLTLLFVREEGSVPLGQLTTVLFSPLRRGDLIQAEE